MSDLIERLNGDRHKLLLFKLVAGETVTNRVYSELVEAARIAADSMREAAAEVERLKDEAKTVDGLFALSQEHGKRLTAAFSAQQQRNAELTAEVERLQRERAERNKTDPVTRLHNLCDAMAEDRDTSPYSQQAWDAQDEAYREKCKEVERLRADAGRHQFMMADLRWQVFSEKRGAKPIRYAMRHDGERWGGWHDTPNAAIDAAIKEVGNGS